MSQSISIHLPIGHRQLMDAMISDGDGDEDEDEDDVKVLKCKC